MGLPNFNSNTYVPPGLYVTENNTPTQAGGSFSGPLLAIVGPGVGYRTYSDGAITLTGTSPASLSQFGINTSSIIVTSPTGQVYTLTTDYTVTSTASTDGNALDTTTTIQRAASGSTITSGEVVTVTYQYTDSSYGLPTLCTNLNQVANLYGPGYNTSTGAITSPLTFAAQFAFANGASQVVAVAAAGSATTTQSALAAALALLSTRTDVTLIAELPVGVTSYPTTVEGVLTDLEAYLVAQENVLIRQMAFIGFESTVTPASSAGLTDAAALATTADYRRIVETWPNAVNFYTAAGTITLPGYYIAAALAGAAASTPADQPLTRLQINGFSGFPPAVAAQMTQAAMNTLAQNGVTVVSLSGGSIVVRHGLTTNPSTVYTREISLVRIEDAMISALVNGIQNSSLIGSPLTQEVLASITGLVTTTLDYLVSSDVITSYQGVTVAVNPSVPTEVDVVFSYLPIYPLDYITISFSIDSSSGA